MRDSHDGIDDISDAPGSLAPDAPQFAVPTAVLAGALLSACGGGGGAGPSAPSIPAPPVLTPPPAAPSAAQASRFLAQASMGATRADIAKVQSLGYAGWLEQQFALPATGTRWDWLVEGGYNAAANKNSEAGGFVGSGWKAFSTAAFLDLLEANAFGNYRTLLQQVSTSAPMGEFLTYRGNVKFNPATGALPDENYARELLQLFTIGLVQLNLDATPKLTTGLPAETYTLDDITGLARVFTGWNYDLPAGAGTDTPDFKRRPMAPVANRHESGSKSFMGATIAAGVDAMTSLTQALDAIYAHPNVAPFISRQLIQRLVCSNPAPDYVARVAGVFNNDGAGVKGNLKAVVEAILLDHEARSASRLADPGFGKLREPVLRLCAWGRAFNATSAGGLWPLGNTSDPATRLGQSPLRSATVFNFFRPGYVPPNSAIASAGMVAPEFQITNESTVVGYVNFMQTVISRGVGDVKGDYSALLPLADTAQLLVDELNLVLAAGQLSASTVALIKGGIDAMPALTDAARLNRIHAAQLLVMAAPEFIVQK